MAGLICWSCGKSTGLEGRVMKTDYCPECQADQRCCRGCRHFDPHAPKQCREPIDKTITNKEKANFCDWFQVRQAVQKGGQIIREGNSKDSRKRAFDDLFKD